MNIYPKPPKNVIKPLKTPFPAFLKEISRLPVENLWRSQLLTAGNKFPEPGVEVERLVPGQIHVMTEYPYGGYFWDGEEWVLWTLGGMRTSAYGAREIASASVDNPTAYSYVNIVPVQGNTVLLLTAYAGSGYYCFVTLNNDHSVDVSEHKALPYPTTFSYGRYALTEKGKLVGFARYGLVGLWSIDIPNSELVLLDHGDTSLADYPQNISTKGNLFITSYDELFWGILSNEHDRIASLHNQKYLDAANVYRPRRWIDLRDETAAAVGIYKTDDGTYGHGVIVLDGNTWKIQTYRGNVNNYPDLCAWLANDTCLFHATTDPYEAWLYWYTGQTINEMYQTTEDGVMITGFTVSPCRELFACYFTGTDKLKAYKVNTENDTFSVVTEIANASILRPFWCASGKYWGYVNQDTDTIHFLR